MKLAFLMERHYAPYSKWFGSAFTKLRIGAKPTPTLQQLSASLFSLAFHVFAYSLVAKQHNALKITKHLPTKVTKYYDRPYLVIHGDNFANEIKKGIKDPQVKRITAKVGSICHDLSVAYVVVDTSQLRRPGQCQTIALSRAPELHSERQQ